MDIKEEFENFLDDQQQENTKVKIDWNEIKEEWVDNVSSFFDMVERFLAKYVQNGKVTTSYNDYLMHEEDLGPYNTKKLIINLGRKRVEFVPVGRLIFGAKGRIDMEGASGKVRFIFTENESKDQALANSFSLTVNGEPVSEKNHIKDKTDSLPVWKISTPPPQLEYIDVNESSFFDALMEVSHG